MGWQGTCNGCFSWQGPWRGNQADALRDAERHARSHRGNVSVAAVPSRRH